MENSHKCLEPVIYQIYKINKIKKDGAEFFFSGVWKLDFADTL